MRTTISKFKYLLIMIVFAGLASCEGPIGADGLDGTNGTDGTDGTDGNANVQTYIYNTPAWGTASGMTIDMTDILTDTVIQTNVIMVYVEHQAYSNYVFAIPGAVYNGSYRNYTMFFQTESFSIVSLEMDGSFTPNANLWPVNWIKVVIIEPTDVTVSGAKSNNNFKETVYDELENAGIDINDYYQVMDYYGLDY